MMFSYNRLSSLFLILYVKDFVSQEHLARQHHVSSRTIRNDIKQLNEELEAYTSKISLHRGHGYVLENKKQVAHIYQSLKEDLPDTSQNLETSQERIKQLLSRFLFSSSHLSLDTLCETLYVSRTTLLTYIRQLKTDLEPYSITIKSKSNVGYRLVGDEAKIRKCISDLLFSKNTSEYITSFTQAEQKFFPAISLVDLAAETMAHFPPTSYRISDYYRKNFIIHLAISITRIAQNCQLPDCIPPAIVMDLNFQSAMEKLLSTLEHQFNIQFPLGEKRWIYLHFISSMPATTLAHNGSSEIERLVNQMIETIQTIFGMDLRKDTLLKKDLFQHFSTYLPIKEILTEKKNPLLDTIKQAYPYAFTVTLWAIEKSALFDKYSLNEDEIGYVALHVAAALERIQDTHVKKKILIVCGQGTSTSRLVETIILKEFRDQVEIVDTTSYASYQMLGDRNAELIVSTIPLVDARIPVVEIDFLSLKKGIEDIRNCLNVNQTDPERFDFFQSDLFFYSEKKVTQVDCLQFLCNELVQREMVPEDFFSQVTKREKLAPTSITDCIAIPHIIDSRIMESKIAVYLSKEPIPWGNGNHSKLIFLIAIAESDKHTLEVFFEKLYEIMSDSKKEKELLSSTTFERFISLLSIQNKKTTE